MVFKNTQGLRNISRAAREGMIGPFFARPLQHDIDALQGFYRPDQDGMRNLFFVSDNIEQMMNAVTKINIGPAGRAEHDLCTGGSSAAKCVRSFVNRPA